MLPWDLEDWLTEEGHDLVVRMDEGFVPSKTADKLLHEIWLLDTEQRNGGISQYFCNHPVSQWKELCRLASDTLPSFPALMKQVNQVIGDSEDPYEMIINSPVDLDAIYRKASVSVVTELKAYCSPHG